LFDYSSAKILGRSGASATATIDETEIGVEFQCQPPDTQWASDLLVSLQRKDISGCGIAAVILRRHNELRDGEQNERYPQETKQHSKVTHYPATKPTFKKWLPTKNTSAHWYDAERFENLIESFIGVEGSGGPVRTINQFVRDFDGLTHTQKAADLVNRAVCEDFEKFKPLFERVQRELKSGIRHTLPVQTMDEIKMAEIQKGEYFIVQGQIAYVDEVGEGFRTQYDRLDSRLRVIYDNGTESNLLMRSFQRALHRDTAGRLITNPDIGPLFAEEPSDGDLASGTIYVLRSKSDHPVVAASCDVLHKIGVTGDKVETRIANAKLDPPS